MSVHEVLCEPLHTSMNARILGSVWHCLTAVGFVGPCYNISPRAKICASELWPKMQCFSTAELFVTRGTESDVNLAHDEGLKHIVSVLLRVSILLESCSRCARSECLIPMQRMDDMCAHTAAEEGFPKYS